MTVVGAACLAASSVGLIPMVEETLALRAARERFDVDRPEETGGGPGEAAFRCRGTAIVLEDGAERGGYRGEGSTAREVVTIRIGPRRFSTGVPVPIHAARRGANRYWGSVMPFRLVDREAGETRCGVVHRLAWDTAAVRKAAAEESSAVAFYLSGIVGARPPFQRGLRFRTLTWAEGGEPTERRYDYDRWSEEPRAVLMANLLLGQIGIENQSLYYWPSLLFPFLYPFGLAGAGALLLAVGTVGRIRGRERAAA